MTIRLADNGLARRGPVAHAGDTNTASGAAHRGAPERAGLAHVGARRMLTGPGLPGRRRRPEAREQGDHGRRRSQDPRPKPSRDEPRRDRGLDLAGGQSTLGADEQAHTRRGD